MRDVGALLLTGGSSSRMGSDKAGLVLAGVPLARSIAAQLLSLVPLAIEVGDGASGLDHVREDPPGGGPLLAILAGHAALLERGLADTSPILVLACDLPLLNHEALELLATYPGDRSVLPVIDGFAQPLSARWSPADLAAARSAAANGERSLQRVPNRAGAELLDETRLGPLATAFRDVDTRADIDALGLSERLIPPADR